MGWLVAVGVALILTYEFWALKQNRGITISEFVWRLSVRYPLIPFAFGGLCGHFFWQSALVYAGKCGH